MNSIILFGMPGGSEWLLILLVVLLIFGGKKIPELMKGLGSGIREFNNAKNDVKDKIREGINEEPKKNNEENS